MASNNVLAGDYMSLMDFALTANAKFRTETMKLQISLDDQTAGIKALMEHASRVENHADHVENQAKKIENVTRDEYENSISWKVTAPLRLLGRTISRALKAMSQNGRS